MEKTLSVIRFFREVRGKVRLSCFHLDLKKNEILHDRMDAC